MVKRISLLMAVLLVFTCNVSAATDWSQSKILTSIIGNDDTEKSTDKSDIIQKLLFHLDIISDPAFVDMSQRATQEEFIDAVAVIAGMGRGENARAELEKSGYLNLKRGKNVTFDEAVFSAVSLINMAEAAKRDGGTAAAFYTLAKQNRLLRNLDYKGGSAITKGEMTQLFYNVISVPVQRISTVSTVAGEMIHYTLDDKRTALTILEDRFDIIMITGVLTAANLTGMFSQTNLDEKTVEIDRKRYRTKDIDCVDYVGMNVAAFVSTEDSNSGEEILFLEPYENDIVRFTADDIASVELSRIRLENSSVRYSDDTAVIVNGIYYAACSEGVVNDFIKPDANFTAVDNDRDGTADCILIWQYKHYVSKFDVGESGTLVIKYDAVIDGTASLGLDDDNICAMVVKEGKVVPYTAIASGDALSIAISRNLRGKKFIKILADNLIVSGMISQLEEDGTAIRVTIGDKFYRLSEQYRELCNFDGTGISHGNDIIKPGVGDKYRFAVTSTGYIADILQGVSGLVWGYLVAVNSAEGLSKTAQARIFTAEGKMLDFDLPDRVIYHDAENMDGITINGREAADKIISRGGMDPRGLVKYSLKAENTIGEIYMTYDNRNGEPGAVDYPVTLDCSVVDKKFYNSRFIGVGNWFLLKDSPLFIVPSVADRDKTRLYAVTNALSKYSGQTPSVTMDLYSADSFGVSHAGLITSGTGDVNLNDAFVFRIVDKVTNAIDGDGNFITRVHVYNDFSGTRKYEYIDFEDPETEAYSVGSWITGLKVKDLQFGDAIYININDDGKGSDFKVFFRASNPGNFRVQDYYGNPCTNATEYLDSIGSYFIYGKLIGTKADTIGKYIKYNAGSNGVDNIIVQMTQNDSLGTKCNYYELDMAKKEITEITMGDLKEGDVFFATRSWGGIYCVAVIK